MQKDSKVILKQYRHHFTILGILAVCGVCIFSCHRKTGDNFRADHGVEPNEISAAFDSLFGSMFGDEEPGAIVALIRDGNIAYNHSFGLARLDHPERITDSTVFNVSSGSQTFAAVALMKLAQAKAISLDDPLSKYFPEFPYKIFSKIKVSDILNHSSGLPDLRPRDPKEWDQYMRTNNSVFCDAADFRLYGSEEEHIKVFSLLDSVDYEPAVHYQRTDPALVLIAPLIERVTGCDYDKWMKDSIFDPAGLRETSYHRDYSKRTKNTSHGYRPLTATSLRNSYHSEDNRWEEFDYGEAEFFLTKADRGAYSSARDVLEFRRKLFDGEIIADSMVNLFRKPVMTVTTTHHADIALGMGLRTRPGYPVSIFHCNFNGGYRYVGCSFPDRNLHYVIISNRSDWDGYQIIDVVDSILHAKEWI